MSGGRVERDRVGAEQRAIAERRHQRRLADAGEREADQAFAHRHGRIAAGSAEVSRPAHGHHADARAPTLRDREPHRLVGRDVAEPAAAVEERRRRAFADHRHDRSHLEPTGGALPMVGEEHGAAVGVDAVEVGVQDVPDRDRHVLVRHAPGAEDRVDLSCEPLAGDDAVAPEAHDPERQHAIGDQRRGPAHARATQGFAQVGERAGRRRHGSRRVRHARFGPRGRAWSASRMGSRGVAGARAYWHFVAARKP